MIVFYEDLLKIEFMDEYEFCEKFGIEDDYWHWVATGDDLPNIWDFNIPYDAVEYIKEMVKARKISYDQAYDLFDILCEEMPSLERYCYF